MVWRFYTAENPWPSESDPLRVHGKDLNHNNPFMANKSGFAWTDTRISKSGHSRFAVSSSRKLGLYPADPEIRIRLDPGNPPPLRKTQALLPPFPPCKVGLVKRLLLHSISSLCSGLWATRPNPAHSLVACLLSAFWLAQSLAH